MILPVTLVIAAAAGIINLWLALRTSAVRRSGQISVGDGGDPRMLARMRAHANFTEYAPFVLILIALIELAKGGSLWLWIAGIVFILGRLLHAFGMERPGANPLRVIGITSTYLILLILSVWAAVIGYGAASAAPPPPAEKTIYLGGAKA